MQHTEPSAVERSLAMYRRLLRAYPPAFRDQYGDEMARVFRDAARAAWRQTGFAGLIVLWARTLADTVVNATRERAYGSDEGVETSRWAVFAGKVRTSVVQMLPVLAVLGTIGGVWALTVYWLPSVPIASRGWAVLTGAILLGMLSGTEFWRIGRVPLWNGSLRFAGVAAWLLLLMTSEQIGLPYFWAWLILFIPALFTEGIRTLADWPDAALTILRALTGRYLHHAIAIAVLLAFAAYPSPCLSTKVLLLLVVVTNGIAAMLPPMVIKARKSDADAN